MMSWDQQNEVSSRYATQILRRLVYLPFKRGRLE